MQSVTSVQTLRSAIYALEKKQAEEELLLRKQFYSAYESLKPVNVLRNVIHDLTTPSEFKNSLLQTAVSLFTGYLSNKLVVGKSNNPFRRFAGILIEYGVANYISNNSETITKIGYHLIKNLAGKSNKSE